MIIRREKTILERQAELLKEIEHTLKQEKRTVTDPYIKLNPFAIAPLTALVAFEDESEDQYQINVNGDFIQITPWAKRQCFILTGLSFNLNNDVVLTNQRGEKFHFQIPIGGSLYKMISAEVSGNPKKGFRFFLPADAQTFPSVIDQEGECRWFCLEKISRDWVPLENGHFLVGAPQKQLPPYEPVDLWEMDFTGFVHKIFHLPNGCTGGFCRCNGKDIAVVSQEPYAGTIADVILWLDRETGTIKNKTALKDILKNRPSGISQQTGSDWVRAYKLIFNDDENELYVVTTHIPSLMVFNGTTGSFERGYTIESCRDLPENPAYWIFIQKEELKNISELLKDFTEGQLSDKSLAKVYLSLQNLNAGESLNFLERAEDGFARCIGVVSDKKEAPFTEEGCSSSREEYLFSNWKGTFSFPVPSFGIFALNTMDFSMKLPEKCGESKGVLAPQPLLDVTLPITLEEELDPDFHLELWHDGERLYFRGDFYQGDVVVLELLGSTKEVYYLEASLAPLGASWYGGHPGTPERRLHWSLPLREKKGSWKVNLCVDDTRYKTPYILEINER